MFQLSQQFPTVEVTTEMLRLGLLLLFSLLFVRFLGRIPWATATLPTNHGVSGIIDIGRASPERQNGQLNSSKCSSFAIDMKAFLFFNVEPQSMIHRFFLRPDSVSQLDD